MGVDIISLRNIMKKKKPEFNKQSSHKKKRLAKKWRKPRGSDSKIKVGCKGYPRKIKIGFKGPAEARGFSRAGLKIVLVKNVNDLKDVDKNKDIVCLSKVGQKKKADIVKECLKLGLNILNLKDPSKFLSNVEEGLKKREEDRKKEEDAKAKKASEKKDKKTDAEKKKGIEAKIDEESNKEGGEEKDEKKKEKDKLLTKREL